MVRRSTSHAKVDDGTFAVRVRIKVPGGGLGKRCGEIYRWLDERVGREGYVFHGGGLLYTNDVEAAAECIRAIGLELAGLPKETP